MKMPSVTEPGREIPVIAEAEVIVVGAGPAGFAAALAAKRAGATTILLEKNTFYGGTLTQATLGSFCGMFTVTESNITEIVRGIAAELVDRLSKGKYALEPRRWLKTASIPFDVTGLKFVMDDMIRESGLIPILDSLVVAVNKSDHGRIDGVVIETKGGRSYVKGRVIVDTTGDADIVAQAGVGYWFDPENLQFPSSMFELHGVDTERAKKITREELQVYLTEAAKSGRFRLPRLAGGIHLTPRPGIVHCNITKVSVDGRPLNPLDPFDITRGEIEGRLQVREYERFFRECVPGFEKAYIGSIGTRLGIRESRRLKGDYVLTAEDVLGCKRFDDAIAASAWPVELHESGSLTKWVWVEPGNYYQIPYRSLISSACPNLLVAGRCISTTHEAQASVRVAGPCFAVGEAAGIAAALASNADVDVSRVSLAKLHTELRKNGAYF